LQCCFGKTNKKNLKNLKFYLFIYSKNHYSPPAPTEELSCTTAPPWGRGD
jgi:hypothetical protein